MRFAKYHGIGNDFVVLTDLDARLGPPGTLKARFVAAVCDRHTGVGADGVIRVMRAGDDAALRMDYYNADGGPAPMCGNGIRCLAVLGQKEGLLAPGEHRVLTGAGPVVVRIDGSERVTVDMGVARLDRAGVPVAGEGDALRVGVEVDGATLVGTGVGMGNPHLVLFADEIGRALNDDLVRRLGPQLEHHAAFPERTNVEFVEVLSREEIRLRVWERGVGETQACGSGACAAAVAAFQLGRTGPDVRVHLPGGDLEVRLDDGHVWMSGPAEEVFEAELDGDWLARRGLALPAIVAS